MARITYALLVALFLITACAEAPTQTELYEAARQCQATGADCDEEWDAWNRAEEALMERERKRQFETQCRFRDDGRTTLACYGGTVDRCYRDIVRGHPNRCRCACVDREETEWLFSN